MSVYLVDENLPKGILPGKGSVHVTDLGERKTDTEIWNYAKEHDLVVVTKGC